jgi:hypothetical protein
MLHPGEVSAENQAVMQSFVEALRQRYGDDFADMASQRIDLSGAHPLSTRTVRTLIQEGDKHRAMIVSLNSLTEERFSISNNFGTRDFGWVWYQILAEKGIQQGFTLQDFTTEKLSKRIAKDIHDASGNGKRIVPDREAETIARNRVEKFITAKKSVMDHIGTMGLDEGNQRLLMDMVRRNEDITSPQQLDAIWATRNEAQALIAILKQDPPPSRSAVLNAMNRLFTTCHREIVPLRVLAKKSGRGFGGDELTTFFKHAIQLGMDIEGVGRSELNRIFTFLSSAPIKELSDVLSIINNGFLILDSDEKLGVAGGLNELRATLIHHVGTRLGLGNEDIREVDKVPSQVENMWDIPPDLIGTLRTMGFDVYTPQDSMETILKSRSGFRDFTAFARTRSADENPLFWREVEQFNGIIDRDEKQKVAQSIVDKFIRDDAEMPINIDGNEREKIIDAVTNGRIDGVFDRAQQEILSLMSMNLKDAFAQRFYEQQRHE